jgi:TRAP-type mannitol/chloroaromatic compound transport system substrate-binding protein
MDAVSNGTIEACYTAAYYYFRKDPTFALFCAVPFGFNTRQQNAWFYDGDGIKLMNEFGMKFNIYEILRRSGFHRRSSNVLTRTRLPAL